MKLITSLLLSYLVVNADFEIIFRAFNFSPNGFVYHFIGAYRGITPDWCGRSK